MNAVRWRWLAVAWVCVGCAAGSEFDEPAVASTTQPLWTINGINFWPNGNVPVCFQPRLNIAGTDEYGTAAYNLQTARIRSVIEAAYESIPGASINFTGWGRCPGPSVAHSRDTSTSPSKSLNPPYFGQVFAGGLKIMIQCDEPNGGELAAYGWQTVGSGYPGASAERVFWTSQSYYAWGAAWDTQVEHEALHALGFQHEFDRDDRTQFCTNEQSDRGPAAGTRWTPYDQASVTNAGYCRVGTYQGDWEPGLTDYDMLGLAIVYPNGASIPVRSQLGVVTSSGLVVRMDDNLISDWTQRGAPDTAIFASTPQWTERFGGVTYVLPNGTTQPVINLSTFVVDVAGSFTDKRGRTQSMGPTTVLVNDSLHTAMLVPIAMR